MSCCKIYPPAVTSSTTDGTFSIPSATQSSSTMKSDLFLSYSRKTEEEFLTILEAELEDKGYSVWKDTTCIPGGAEWHTAVAQAILSSKAFVCLITKDFMKSQHCKNELFLAESKQKLILPIILENQMNFDLYPGVSLVLISLNWIQPKLPGPCEHGGWGRVASEAATQLLEALKDIPPSDISKKLH